MLVHKSSCTLVDGSTPSGTALKGIVLVDSLLGKRRILARTIGIYDLSNASVASLKLRIQHDSTSTSSPVQARHDCFATRVSENGRADYRYQAPIFVACGSASFSETRMDHSPSAGVELLSDRKGRS